MHYDLQKILSKLEKQRRFLWNWRKVLTGCAAVVVFWTTYAMILPAITWEQSLICQVEEHTHGDACYEMDETEQLQLTCQLEEHTHEASCFDAPPAPPPEYLCGKEEHIHAEDCFFEDGTLKCTMEDHSHTDACLIPPAAETEEIPEYLCGKEEHAHAEGCFLENGTLKCTMEDHSHTDDCLIPPAAETEEIPEYLCGKEEHTHTEDCFPEGEAPQCTLEVHTHTDACLTAPEEETEEESKQEEAEEESKQEEIEEESEEFPCGMEEHTHSRDSCYDEGGQLLCQLEEHTHSMLCFGLTSMPMLLAEAPTSKFELPPMITDAAKANDWQVVSGRYLSHESDYDGSQAQIIQDENGNVLRLRKNLVPTGTENEFYVYLSVEPVYYHLWEEIFAGSGMVLNSANDSRDYGSIQEGFTNAQGVQAFIDLLARHGYGSQGKTTLLVPNTAPYATNNRLNAFYTTQTGKDHIIKAVLLKRTETDTNPIRIDNQQLIFSFSQNSTDSFTIIYCAPNSNHLVKLSKIHWDQQNATLTFPHEAYDALVEANSEIFDHIKQRTLPQLVTDPMGEHITYLGLEYCSTGDSTVNFSGNTLYWDLSNTAVEPSQDPNDYEQIDTDDAFSRSGAFQLVYKVRLNVTDPGFNSAAAQLHATSGPTVYPTNGDTTVTYRTDKMTSGTSRTAHFRVPEVRGVLYDVFFRKLDQYGRGVVGAQFTLKDANGTVLQTLTTKDNGIYTMGGVPWGTYYLEEQAPENYSVTADGMVSTKSWTLPLCYTTHPELMIPDTSQSIGDMIYTGGEDIPFEMGALKLVNYLFTREFLMRKVDTYGNPLSGAQFKLYTDAALTQEVNTTFHPSDETGIFTGVHFTLPVGTYYLAETTVPRGYISPPTAGVLTVSSDGGFHLFWNGKNYEPTVTVDGFHTTYSVKVENRPSVPLPATGGRGTGPIVAAGVLVLLATWSYYFMQRRKKAGEAPDA